MQSAPKKTVRQVEAADISQTLCSYFKSFYKTVDASDDEETVRGEPNFQTLISYCTETTAEPSDLLYSLLTGILEEKYERIEQYLPKII